MALPRPDSVPAMDTSDLSRVIADLFEPSPELVALLQSDSSLKNVSTYSQLILLVRTLLMSLLPASADTDAPLLDSILGSHPRLGAPKPDSLSAASRLEQSQLQAVHSPEARQQVERLAQLNDDYEQRFPGLRYVVFVNARPRHIIMEDMHRRISNSDRRTERSDAIQAMCDIANDRVAKMGIRTDVSPR